MGRGVSAGGGQSSLGYLFGSGEGPKPSANRAETAPPKDTSSGPSEKPADAAPAPPPPSVVPKETPAGVPGSMTNNYQRADGQNCGNFITDRPSTKVHAAPGGGSSLGYLFGDGSK